MGYEKKLELKSTLERFVSDVNSNEKVQRLIKKWSSTVNFWARDQGFGFVLEVVEGRVVRIQEAKSVDDGKVKVVADYETLLKMFQGKENIAHLYLEGVVETYGSERDQIVLDAVARLLWG